jgi:hypothetical protein
MPKKSSSSLELQEIITNQNKNEEYLLHHYRTTTKNIIKSLNTLIGKNCQAFPYRFKCINYGDIMYDRNELIGSKGAKPPLRCISPEFGEEQIIVYAHTKGMIYEAASYLEFEVLNDKSEVHILASCTFAAHERKNLSVLLRFIPIFLMLSYKLEKVTSDTNELSGGLLVQKLGFTRTEKYFGDKTHYHETYLKSTDIEEKYLKEQFVNTACGTSNITERLPFLRQNVRKRKILSPTTLKDVPNITVVKDLGNVKDSRDLFVTNAKIISAKNKAKYLKEKQKILALEKEYNALCIKYMTELSQDLTKMPVSYLKQLVKSVKKMWEDWWDLDLKFTKFNDLNLKISELYKKIGIVHDTAKILKKNLKKNENKGTNAVKKKKPVVNQKRTQKRDSTEEITIIDNDYDNDNDNDNEDVTTEPYKRSSDEVKSPKVKPKRVIRKKK